MKKSDFVNANDDDACAHVILACRNVEKAEKARTDIQALTGRNDVTVMQLDLASTSSVRKFVEQLIERTFLLTVLLLDRLRESAPSRVVTLSSVAHGYGQINWDDLMSEKSYSKMGAYSQSKLANILFSRELARRMSGTGVSTYAVHPGYINTAMWNRLPLMSVGPLRWLTNLFLDSPLDGAQTSIHCAVSEELAEETGLYYS
ncbi:PREDICTED: retinol dehydrogenase 11-like [Priapulus caudatus]|uniref:Retinol dehydrogenase 11-like n=1 Tax=Priapulus caudatus TaxID=37621 RepID=A0ABM1F4N5_PRICU|nr:PREDICTED: retinol dehydrogenase 11-like [Priapulus caudatus]